MLQQLSYSPFEFSPTNSIKSDSERRPSSSDAGYCSSTNLLRTPFDGDLLEIGSDFQTSDYRKQVPCLPPQVMSFGSPKEALFSADQAQSSQMVSGNRNLQRDVFYQNNPPMRRTSLVEVPATHRRGLPFCRSEVSAFTPCAAKPNLSPNRRPTGRIPTRMNGAKYSNGSDISANQPVESFAGFNADAEFSQQPDNLARRYSSNPLYRPPADPLRRLHSDGTLHEFSRWSTADELLTADYSFKYADDSHPAQCMLQQGTAARTASWEGSRDAKQPFMDQFNCVETPTLTAPRLQGIAPQRYFSEGGSNMFESMRQYDLALPENLDQFSGNRGSDAMNLANSLGGGQGAVDASKQRYTAEDEAWRTYLENPLTAATTAMMSIHGDEDSAAALGILYDYYKVPREKRILAYQTNDGQDLETRSCNGQLEPDPNNGALSDEVTLLSPVSTISNSRAHSNPCTQSDALLRDVTTDGVMSPSHIISASDVDMVHNNILTIRNIGTEVTRSGEVVSSLANSVNRQRGVDSSCRNVQCLTPECSLPVTTTSPAGLGQNSVYSGYVPKQELCSTMRNAATCGRRDIPNAGSVSPSPFINFNANTGSNVVLSPTSATGLLGSPGLASAFTADELFQSNQCSDRFEYTMEAPKSLKQKEGEPTMSYINKGQFYCITLRECSGLRSRIKSGRVTSVVQVVFGDAKPEDEQLRHWKYWHQRQHTTKQRVIDIADYKESYMLSDIEEFAHNAVSFKWDVSEPAKIFVSCNCLSTDFSAQKGIKGLPLLLQIDTYLDDRRSGPPIHRGNCQLKVFCDKGAERKIRDEERKALRKKQKVTSAANVSANRLPVPPVDIKPVMKAAGVAPSSSASSATTATSHKRLDIVYFRSVADRTTPAVHFVPDMSVASNRVQHVTTSPCQRTTDGFISGLMMPSGGGEIDHVFANNQGDSMDAVRGATKRSHSMVSSEDGDPPSNKLARLADCEANKRVLLYVRKENEDVYDGVMLQEPTLKGLKDALQEKYNIPAQNITKVLKKSRKGIMVNVDDNIVRHYSNEDTFCIDIIDEGYGGAASYKVTLTVV